MTLGRSASRPWTPADDAQLLALLASGLDGPSIAGKLQRSVHAIANRKSNLKQQATLQGLDRETRVRIPGIAARDSD
jgi:hypothetical protein